MARRAASGQLSLALEPADTGALVTIERWALPMSPGEAEAPFDDPGWFFEPWWPGVPATLVLAGDGMRLLSGQLGDPLAAFPELSPVRRQVRAATAVVPGTLLVLAADGTPDLDALHHRLAEPTDRSGTGAFIAADLLAHDGELLTELPFAVRRGRLLEIVDDGDRFLASRGLHGEGSTLADAAASMGMATVSARRLDAPWRAGVAADAWLRFPVVGQPARPTRPLLVLLQRLPLD